MKYLLFAGSIYYPRGGIDDLVGGYETIEEAVKNHKPDKNNITFQWAHIVSIETLHIIAVFDGEWHPAMNVV